MNNYEIAEDEVILLQEELLDDNKEIMKLILTSKKIVVEKEREVISGLFKKEKKIVNDLIEFINISSIKVYKNAVQVKQNGSNVEIQSISKNINLKFKKSGAAKKFVTIVTDEITGTTEAERNANKIKGTFEMVDDVLKLDTRNIIKNVVENGVQSVIFKGIGKGKKDNKPKKIADKKIVDKKIVDKKIADKKIQINNKK